jgi:hypothetical protein
MEDIEDLVVGAGAPPGFRLPLNAVGVSLKKKKSNKLSQTLPSPKIPGTQVSLSLFPSLCGLFSCKFLSIFYCFLNVLLQTIYIKTFGCSHNQASFVFFFFALICIEMKMVVYFIRCFQRLTVHILARTFMLEILLFQIIMCAQVLNLRGWEGIVLVVENKEKDFNSLRKDLDANYEGKFWLSY